MPELLLEVGCEELPAAFVRKAYTDLRDAVAAELAQVFGQSFEGIALGAPRRLIVGFSDVPPRQADSVKELRGPSLKAAFDEQGRPTQALLGFCRSNGAEPPRLRKDEQYVWLDKPMPGLAAWEILAEILPKAIRGLAFEKSMRWGAGKLRFARPIRWILAAYGGEAVEFEIEGVAAGLESRGHRFYAPESFEATSMESLLEGLRKRKVEPDPGRRRETIIAAAKAVAGGEPDLPEDLLDENVFLAEWPDAVVGEFRADHLELPAAVLTTAMAKHERMFPVRDGGNITRRFVFVRNGGEDETVRRGAEWVLNARLDDAQFFYREDAKHDLDFFLEKTSGIVFQAQLGTVRQRADRLASLAKGLAIQGVDSLGNANRFDGEETAAAIAGKYAKADLSTGLVSDMASLQGVVGGEYAKLERDQERFSEAVRWTISTQYDHSRNIPPDDTKKRVATYVIAADQLDKLAGYLGLGLIPSGSSDPYGLRRSAQILIDIGLRWPFNSVWRFDRYLEEAVGEYAGQQVKLDGDSAVKALAELFRARYVAHFADQRFDFVAAASTSDVCSPQVVRNRIEVLNCIATDEAFILAALRAVNIVRAETKKGWIRGFDITENGGCYYPKIGPHSVKTFDGASLSPGESHQPGAQLAQAVNEFFLWRAQAAAKPQDIANQLAAFTGPINRLLDGAMINDHRPQVRQARLDILGLVSGIIEREAGDLTKLQG